MRKRSEIIKECKSSYSSQTDDELIIEVLLDIRDILNEMNINSKIIDISK